MFAIKDPNFKKILWMVTLFTLFLSAFRFMQFYTFNNHALDDGFFDNLLWNTLHGQFLYSDIKGFCAWGDHLNPILLVFLPFYLLGLGPWILYFGQTLAVAVGAIPIYWLAKEKIKDQYWHIFFPLAYLVYIPTVNVTFQGFYQIALAISPLLFCFYYLLKDKYWPFFLWLLVALLCQEDVSLVAAFIGLYILLTKEKKWLGGLLLVSGFLLFITDMQVIIPFFRGSSYQYFERYAYLGNTLPDKLKTILCNPILIAQHALIPEKLLYIFGLLLPVAFLPIFSPLELIPIIPVLAQNLLSTYRDMWQLGTRYPSSIIPFVFLAAILGFSKLKITPRHERIIRRTMLFCIILSLLYFFLGFFIRYIWINEPVIEGHQILMMIPKDASISAIGNLYPHLAHRKNIWLFPKNWEKADYIILQSLDPTWPINGDCGPTVKSLWKKHDYGKLLEYTFVGEVPKSPMDKTEYLNYCKPVLASNQFSKIKQTKYFILLKHKL